MRYIANAALHQPSDLAVGGIHFIPISVFA